MQRFLFLLAASAALAPAAPSRADLTITFAGNPLSDGSALVQGPDAPNAASRFTYNADHTLTAHYDSAQPTIKLVFPLGAHLTPNSSFTVTATFRILSSGFVAPADFGAQAPSFGLVNSAATGDIRASTGYYDSGFNFIEVTPGTSYDLLAMDYFPTQDFTYGGNSVDLTVIHTAQNGVPFSDLANFTFGYASATLPFDQTITATLACSADTHTATLDYGAGSIPAALNDASFNVDSFALTLWNDPNLAPAPPAVAYGSRVAADVVFESFSVTVAPEPGTLALLACGALALARHRNRRRN
jgi:hypothetical protein